MKGFICKNRIPCKMASFSLFAMNCVESFVANWKPKKNNNNNNNTLALDVSIHNAIFVWVNVRLISYFTLFSSIMFLLTAMHSPKRNQFSFFFVLLIDKKSNFIIFVKRHVNAVICMIRKKISFLDKQFFFPFYIFCLKKAWSVFINN